MDFALLHPLMLYVKKSKLPKAGKGLFTDSAIKRGEIVCEYQGEKLTWKECEARNAQLPGKQKGAYFFFISGQNCRTEHDLCDETTDCFFVNKLTLLTY